MSTFKLIIEYDGTGYAGWQRQPDRPTIQAAIEMALSQVCQAATSATGASRTDAGVHAFGQVVSFRTGKNLAAEDWEQALNGLLPPDICVYSVEQVPNDFHARYSAREKTYEYRILNRQDRSALDRHRIWHIRKPLAVEAMRKAAEYLAGKHDFSSFQGSPTDNENPLCDLRALDLIQESHLIRIEARADRFLKQMVRAIVGTLVEVGIGRRQPEDVKTILEAKDRKKAGKTAPPHGLYLVKVEY